MLKRLLTAMVGLCLIGILFIGAVEVPDCFVTFDDTVASNLTISTKEHIVLNDGQIYGLSEDEFRSYLDRHNTVLYGSSTDAAFVFHLDCVKTEFSEKVGDFAALGDADIATVSASLIDSYDEIVSVNETKYLRISETVAEKNLVTVQYITVKNNRMYVLTFNTIADDAHAREMTAVLGAVRIAQMKTASGKTLSPVWIILVSILIVLLVAVTIITVISLVRVIKRKENE